MTRFLQQVAAPLLAFIGLALLSPSVMAETPFPTINEPSDKSVKCIQPEDVMRREHMNYILHERDETMHKGIRGEDESLANCIDCHVEPDANGEIAGIESDQHFCNSCHEYAAVQIDCFQCHADRPQKYIKRDGSASSNHGTSHQPAIYKQLQQTLAASSVSADKATADKATEGVQQ